MSTNYNCYHYHVLDQIFLPRGPTGGLQRAHPCHQVRRPRALLEDTNIQDGAVAGP